MKEKSPHPRPISCIFSIALITLFFIAATHTPALAARPRVDAGMAHTVGLDSDGTILKAGFGSDDIGSWTDIVQLSAGYVHTVGLKSNGTVVATGCSANDWGQCDVGSWTDIIQVSAGYEHTVGLKSNGTVVATGCGANDLGQCDVGSWTNIVQVDAYNSTVGIKSDGTVVKVGYGEGDVGSWTDIIQVAAGYSHTVGLKLNGTVLATGCDSNAWGQCDVGSWTNIAQVAAGYAHTVGLKSNGTVLAAGCGSNDLGQCDVSAWTNIAQIAAGYEHTVGLKSNGTVLAVGNNSRGQSQVDEWKFTLFEDVPVGNWAEDYIYAILNAKITQGCSQNPLKYCPQEIVSRAENAAFIVRAKEGEPPADYCATGSPFPDVSSDTWPCKYIKRLSELGITQGCGGDNYCPNDPVTRDQMAAFLVRAVEGEPPADYCATGSPFSDVSADTWPCKYIKRLSELGITKGCGGGNYCPNDPVTRDQMAAFIARAFLGMD